MYGLCTLWVTHLPVPPVLYRLCIRALCLSISCTWRVQVARRIRITCIITCHFVAILSTFACILFVIHSHFLSVRKHCCLFVYTRSTRKRLWPAARVAHNSRLVVDPTCAVILQPIITEVSRQCMHVPMFYVPWGIYKPAQLQAGPMFGQNSTADQMVVGISWL